MIAPRNALHPPIEPFNRFRLQVSGGHDLYVEECGTPGAKPVIVLHGGPGGGISASMRRYFNPAAHHVVLFDQRGCGRSRPHASIESNTTWDLISDIEAIRRRLGVERWMVFGGSWGAFLGLLYAQTHPKRVSELVLRGVFLMTRAELNWFYGGAAAAFWPDRWAEFVEPIPEAERSDLIHAYHKRLTGGDVALQVKLAQAWTKWESVTAALTPSFARESAMADASYARAFARLEAHYFVNQGFLEADDQIMRDVHKIRDIPGVIVQGRYDMVCPPKAAWDLHHAWPASKLHIVADAGHALSEPGISAALLQAVEEFRWDGDESGKRARA